MGRKPRVDRSPEEKWQIVQEGIKSGNISETCRRHGIAANLFYRSTPTNKFFQVSKEKTLRAKCLKGCISLRMENNKT